MYKNPITNNYSENATSQIPLLDKVKMLARKKYFIGVLVFIVIIAGAFIVSSFYKKPAAKSNQAPIAAPVSSQTLNKEFDFNLNDSKGNVVSTLKYIIQSAEIRNEIIVKGQKATAIDGKEFLIINLKIVNGEKSGVQINTKDYVRLSLNGNTDEWLAPDIHNDPVDVQAISTKYTRVGFAIAKSDKNLVLRVGEINGAKSDINLNLNQ